MRLKNRPRTTYLQESSNKFMDGSDFIDSFYNSKPQKKSDTHNEQTSGEQAAKFKIFDEDAFDKGRKLLGGIILKGMRTSGGTDIDWIIEHKGNFIVLEFKELHNEQIVIRLGQMITYEKLHEKLNQNGKCYVYFIGCGYDIDFGNSNYPVWIFEMLQWKNGGIPFNTETQSPTTSGGIPKKYYIHKDFMEEITVGDLRKKLENHWYEFENKKLKS